jgi:P-type Cu2+ transporter
VNAADVPADVFALAGQLALSSHHPVAAAVAEAASAKSPLVGAVEEPGQGLRAECGGVEIRLGKPSFCGAEQMPRDNANLGPEASIVAFSRGKERYLFSVRQALRQDARAAISLLEQRGIAVEILSGDRELAIRTAAGVLGIDEWRAGVTPAGKIARIEELKRRGSKLMMVGDSMTTRLRSRLPMSRCRRSAPRISANRPSIWCSSASRSRRSWPRSIIRAKRCT